MKGKQGKKKPVYVLEPGNKVVVFSTTKEACVKYGTDPVSIRKYADTLIPLKGMKFFYNPNMVQEGMKYSVDKMSKEQREVIQLLKDFCPYKNETNLERIYKVASIKSIFRREEFQKELIRCFLDEEKYELFDIHINRYQSSEFAKEMNIEYRETFEDIERWKQCQ